MRKSCEEPSCELSGRTLTSRQESCRGCGQMLVAEPAGGGGPTCLRLSPSPSSLQWRRRQMESGGSAPVPAVRLQSVRLSSCLARRRRARGTWGRRPASSPPPPQGSIAYREGSPLRLLLLQTLCYLPVDVNNNCTSTFKFLSSARGNIVLLQITSRQITKTWI